MNHQNCGPRWGKLLHKTCVEDKMDGLKNGMEDMEEKMEDMKNDIKADMEGLKKLIQKMIPNGENIVKENHDENKINVNHDFINPNIGLNTNHIPMIDMRKFDGKDPITWILQMKKYFDLNNVKNKQNVRIATLHLEQNTFVWYLWLCSHKKIATWSIFTEEMIAHYEDTNRNTFFSQLINLKQKCSVGNTLRTSKNLV